MLTQDIIKHIKDDIITSKFPPGKRIVEAQICRDLGVGRSRVREALRHLEQEDFIRRIPNASPFVKALSQKDIAQIYDLMGVLEGLSVRIAASTINAKELRKIEGFINSMEKYQNDKFKVFHYNYKFHQYLTELGGNPRLISFVNLIRAQASRMSLQSFYNPEQIRSSLLEHRKIFNALGKGQASRAENYIRAHYLTSKNRLIKYINSTL